MNKDFNVERRDFPLRRGGVYHITYKGAELSYPSVTSILSTSLPKPQLTHWAAKQTAIAALNNPALSVEEAVGAIYKKRDAAGGLGKIIHSWAESHIKGETLDLNDLTDELKPYGEAFLSFISSGDYKPFMVKDVPFSEITVFNVDVGYAGTLDYAAKDNKIYDWKTGKGVYLDHHMQQLAYLNATHAILPNKTIIEMPKFTGAYLVHLRNTGRYSVVEVEGSFDDFLKIFEVYKVLKKFEG